MNLPSHNSDPEARQTRQAEATELSRQRTELAKERTQLANKRTMLAWCRTALGIMAFAFAIDKFLLSKNATGTAAGYLSITAFICVTVILPVEAYRFFKLTGSLGLKGKAFTTFTEAVSILLILLIAGAFLLLDSQLLR